MAVWKKRLIRRFHLGGEDRPYKAGDAGVLSAVHVPFSVQHKILDERVRWATNYVESYGWSVHRVDKRGDVAEIHIWRGPAGQGWL